MKLLNDPSGASAPEALGLIPSTKVGFATAFGDKIEGKVRFVLADNTDRIQAVVFAVMDPMGNINDFKVNYLHLVSWETLEE